MDWLYGVPLHWTWLVLYVFCLVGLVQLFYYWVWFSRIAFYKDRPPADFDFPPVSVVICARNEYRNLEKNLPLILEQNYENFEVVVVDDFSEDDSEILLQQLQGKYKYLKVIKLRENVNFFKGKKLALSVGIKSAKNEVLLLTDADCRPAGPKWIEAMVRNYQGNTRIVLGYGAYASRPGFLNKLIRFDTLFIAIQYFGFALAGKPYMGVGRNLSYHRSLFFKAKGFTSHYKVTSGDDDLFINQVATKNNTAIEISPESHTISIPKKTIEEWFRQKRRHLTTGRHYKKRHRFMLGFFHFSQVLFYGLFVFLLVCCASSLIGLIAAGMFLLRVIVMQIVLYYACKRFNERKLFLYSLLADIVLTFFNILFAIPSRSHKKNKWK